MGVDFITCYNDDCQYNFPDCGDFYTCENCEEHFCSRKCANAKYDDEADQSKCLYCRGEAITQDTLFSFLLSYYNLTYDEAVELYKKEQKDA